MTGTVFHRCALVALLFITISVNCTGKTISQKFLAGIKLGPFGRTHTSRQKQQAEDAHSTKFPEPVNRVLGNAALMFHGAVGVAEKVYHSAGLVYQQRRKGLTSISFEEFHYIDSTMTDASRLMKRVTWAPLGKKFFYFTNLALPLVSSNPLKTFWDHPSTFLEPENQEARKEILKKKRMQAAVQALTALQEERVLLDVRQNALNEKNTQLVERALQQPSLAQALDVLEPMLVTKGSAAQRLQVKLPGSLAKQCLQALGVLSVPDLPVLRLANTFRLRNRVDYIRSSDDFLVAKGLSALSSHEVRLACFERCISTEDRPDEVLRAELSEWLQLVRPAVPATTTTGTTVSAAGIVASAAAVSPSTTAHGTATAPIPTAASNTTLPTNPTLSGASCAAAEKSNGSSGVVFRLASLMARLTPTRNGNKGTVSSSVARLVESNVSTSSALPVVEQESAVCVPPLVIATVNVNITALAIDSLTNTTTTPTPPTPPLPQFTSMPALLLSQLKPPALTAVAAFIQPKLTAFTHLSKSKIDTFLHDRRVKQKKNSEIVQNLQNRRLAMMALHSLKSLRNSSFGGVYRAALGASAESGGIVGNSTTIDS